MAAKSQEEMIKEMYEALVGSIDGTPGLMERVRVLECFRKTIIGKFNVIFGVVVTNIGIIFTTAILLYLKLK